MTRISNTEVFPNDTNITDKDYWIGTDGDDSKKTKTFTAKIVREYIEATTDGISQNNIPLIITTEDLLIRPVIDINTPVLEPFEVVNNTDYSITTGSEDTFLTVSDKNIIIFKIPVTRSGFSQSNISFDYYLLVGTGKGKYGVGGDTTITADNLFFLKGEELVTVTTDSNLSPVIYTVYDTVLDDIDNSVNNSTPSVANPLTVDNTRDYYFKVIKTGAASKFIDTALYRFTKDVPSGEDLGVGGSYTTVSGDFELIELNEREETQIKTRQVVVGAVVDKSQLADDSPAKAIARSFRGQIDVSGNEVVLFLVNRRVGNRIDLEQYYWKNGKANNVTTGITDDDLILDYVIKGSTFSKQVPNSEPVVYSINAVDSSQPHTALNGNDLSGGFEVDNDSYDTFFVVYDNNGKFVSYKVYRFVGDSGTYGADGAETAILADFLLVDSIGSTNENDDPIVRTDDGIKIRTLQLGTTIDRDNIADDDIAKAVDRSFRGIIAVNDNEILRIQVQVKENTSTASKRAFKLYNYVYDWASGTNENIADGNATVDDYSFVSKFLVSEEIETAKPEDADVIDVNGKDKEEPEIAVNNSTTPIVRDDATKDTYVIVTENNEGSKDYEVYKFEGADGTYGAGQASTAVNGDFTKVDKTEDVELESAKLSSFINDGNGDIEKPFLTEDDIDVSGLEAIDEGNGTGWRLIDRDPANYGNIGSNAVDFSDSDEATNTNGAVGSRSFVTGKNNEGQVPYSSIFGSGNKSFVGNYSVGTFISGFENEVYPWSYGTFTSGYINKLGTPGSTGGGNPIIYYSGAIGYSNNIYGGRASYAIGAGLTGGSAYTVLVGAANVDLTSVTANQSWSPSNSPLNPAFIVGTGDVITPNAATPTFTRKNGFVVWRNDTAELPNATIANIDARGAKAVPTVEWVQANAGGAVDSINGNTGTVVLDADDIDDTSTTNKYATQAQLDKVDYLTVTGAIDLDKIRFDRLNDIGDASGTINLDMSSYETFYITLTGTSTLALTNTPSTGFSKTITINITGDETLNLPGGWNVIGTYDGTVDNKIVVQYVKSGVIDASINPTS